MADKDLQTQINALNQKMDLVLEYVNQQRLKSESVEDLIADFSIVGKDIYDSTVAELENQAVEIDPDQLRILGVKLLKNIDNISTVMQVFESSMDFLKDAAPLANELIIDFQKKLSEFENKGYFEFFAELATVADNVITHFTKEDVRQLADNVVIILETVKSMTQPDVLKSVDNAIKVYGSLETKEVQEMSLFGLMREMRKPEMKQAIGFTISFLKNLSATTLKKAS